MVHKYPNLKTNEQDPTTENSLINHLSNEKLTVPSQTLIDAAHTFEPLFNQLHGDMLTNKPNIIKDLSTQLEKNIQIKLPEEVFK